LLGDMHDVRQRSTDLELMSLDVHVVDVLAHLESLLRASHLIQRALLTLRAEAPPPAPEPTGESLASLRDNVYGMRRDCQMLNGIIDDLMAGIESLAQSRGSDRPPLND
jgi:hypothetical protein